MTTIRAFVWDLVKVFVEHEIPEKFLIPGGLPALEIRLDAYEPMPREMICRGYQGLADYLSKITGEEVVVLFSVPARIEGNGHDLAWMVIDQFEAWRHAREQRGLHSKVYLHSACQAFVAGLLGDNEEAEAVGEESRGMTREEVVSVLEPVLGLILRDARMRGIYGAALDAHSDSEDFGAILDLAVVAVACEEPTKTLTPGRLEEAVERAEIEFVVHEAQRRSDVARPD